MNETRISIPSSHDVTLDARFARGTGEEIAVLCHPHPQYGGSMDNNVVITARDLFAERGIATIRFNMRGVGASTGHFAQGKGEARDVAAVCAHAGTLVEGPVHLVAYSFGAWVSLLATADGLRPSSLALVSPPVDFVSFEGLALPHCPCLVVAGDRDDFCSTSGLKRWLDPLAANRSDIRVETLPHTDHFYAGREHLLEKALADFFQVAGRTAGH